MASMSYAKLAEFIALFIILPTISIRVTDRSAFVLLIARSVIGSFPN